jgi:hypothetical protein
MDVYPEDDGPRPDPADLARDIVATNRYLTLATADANGLPWSSPVFFATGAPGEFLWVSRPEAVHSRNIAVRPEVSLTIFDSSQRPGTGQGVYVAAVAAPADPDRIADYSRGSLRWGVRPWSIDDVTGDAPFRLYLATAREVWVLDSVHDPRGDFRTAVTL